MQRVLSKFGIPILMLVAISMSVIGIWGERGVASTQQTPALAIGPNPPTELNATGGGPAQATLQQAAEFAWEEFFALNWPAGPQSGQPGQRDTPSSSCHFGDQSSSCAGPLVWETYRGKVEIFPGDHNPPPGYSATAPSYGYDVLPQYNYGALHPVVSTHTCSGGNPPPTGWVNLDETDQITEDSMYAGVAPVSVTSPPINSAPQLIRFLAKANRRLYEYVAEHKWWDGSAPTEKTANYVTDPKYMKDPPDGDNYVLLPDNTIEVKAGWRVLNPSEMASGKFHTATVRYYERVKESDPDPRCYEQATFGLISLHIIQKTKMAPYFIYATFEQADNILDEKGQSVEGVDGSLLPNPSATVLPPTTPSVTLNDSSTSTVPPQVVTVPAKAAYCTPDISTRPPNRLFYLNASQYNSELPTNGYICINKRDNDILPVIVDTNKRAHALIPPNSVWQNYKLINVQYQPINKDYAGPYGTKPGENDFLTAHNPSTYYLSNIVVETNRPLQLFSGSLPGGGGANSEYESQFSGKGGIHRNMFYAGNGYNMGGCMGCHGAQGQSAGGDFSVIMARGPVRVAETPAPPTSEGAAAIPRNRSLVKYH
jgi:hypothetical protein